MKLAEQVNMNFVPERYETECLDRIDGQIAGASMMSRDERLFINGLVRRFKPKKVLEVGVSMGGGTCVLLNAVGDDPDAVVHSVDWSERYYMDSSKVTGWEASELFAGTPKWRPHLGYDASEVIEEIGGGVDFVVLDTVHWHPGETLSFISVFPFLTRDAVVVLHDVNEYFFGWQRQRQAYATKLLFDVVTADKITLSEFIGGYAHPNIGAFQVNEDTHRYITDVFRSLFFPWGYEVPERVLRGTERIIREKYGEREPFYLRFGLAQAFLLSGALSCAQAFRRSRASFTSSFRPSMRPWGIREILASFWCVRYVAFRLRGFTTEASLKERV